MTEQDRTESRLSPVASQWEFHVRVGRWKWGGAGNELTTHWMHRHKYKLINNLSYAWIKYQQEIQFMRLSAVTLSTALNFRLFRISIVRIGLMRAGKGCTRHFMQNLWIIACEFQATYFKHFSFYEPIVLCSLLPVCACSNRILTKFVHLN